MRAQTLRTLLAGLATALWLGACSKAGAGGGTTTSADAPAPQASNLTADSGRPGPNAAAGALNPQPRSSNVSD